MEKADRGINKKGGGEKEDNTKEGTEMGRRGWKRGRRKGRERRGTGRK